MIIDLLEKKISYAELHLHFGGANTPKTLWQKNEGDFKQAGVSVHQFKSYEEFQAFFERKRESLEEYLEMHKVVISVQRIGNIDFYIKEIMRRSAESDNVSYIEIRHCPYGRTDSTLTEQQRIKQMKAIVIGMNKIIRAYSDGSKNEKYDVNIKQIICLNSQLNRNINSALLDLSIDLHERGVVCGIDIAGGESSYNAKEIIGYFKRAKENNLNTTAHIFETESCSLQLLDLIPYLDRIGHGTFIPIKYKKELKYIAEKNICMEICPTTYLKCGTFANYSDKRFRYLFDTCEEMNVAIVIGTDNGGIHQVSLQEEFENLLINNIINKEQSERYRMNAFRYAFSYLGQNSIFEKVD